MKRDAPTTPTARQLEILRLVAQDCTNAGIARRLGIAEHTVKKHLWRLRAATGCHGRAGAVAEGFRRGWLR